MKPEQGGAETFEGKPCDRCGSTTRYLTSGTCRDCNRVRNQARTWSGPLTTELRLVARQPDAHPFDRNGRLSSDESGGLATYYRGPFFDLCELCGRPGLVDGIVCELCAPRCHPAPESHSRPADVSDVLRVLREIGARP